MIGNFPELSGVKFSGALGWEAIRSWRMGMSGCGEFQKL